MVNVISGKIEELLFAVTWYICPAIVKVMNSSSVYPEVVSIERHFSTVINISSKQLFAEKVLKDSEFLRNPDQWNSLCVLYDRSVHFSSSHLSTICHCSPRRNLVGRIYISEKCGDPVSSTCMQ